jgi:hypothetical protein
MSFSNFKPVVILYSLSQRLDSLPVDIANDVLLGVTKNSSSVNAVTDSDVVLLIDILDYVLSKLLSVSSGDVILPPNIEDSSCSQKCLKRHLNQLLHSLKMNFL